MIDCQVLDTGSQGNAVIINQAVMIDCGVPYKTVEPYLMGLKLVLLTHIHGDHFRVSTIQRIARERPTLRFGACEWLVRPLMDAGVPAWRIDPYRIGFRYQYSIGAVEPVPLSHDVPNCGYKLYLPGGNAIYATDTRNLNGIEARGFDLFMIEANYEDEEIQRRINDKKAEGLFSYEKRVLDTHLSRAQADDFIYRNLGPTSEIVYLHGHRERETNNDCNAEGHSEGA